MINAFLSGSGSTEIDIKEPAQVSDSIKVPTIKSFDRMREFRAIDCQNEDDMVHGKQVLGNLEEFDGIGRAASVQFIDHHYQGAIALLDFETVPAMSFRTLLNSLIDFCASW